MPEQQLHIHAQSPSSTWLTDKDPCPRRPPPTPRRAALPCHLVTKRDMAVSTKGGWRDKAVGHSGQFMSFLERWKGETVLSRGWCLWEVGHKFTEVHNLTGKSSSGYRHRNASSSLWSKASASWENVWWHHDGTVCPCSLHQVATTGRLVATWTSPLTQGQQVGVSGAHTSSPA